MLKISEFKLSQCDDKYLQSVNLILTRTVTLNKVTELELGEIEKHTETFSYIKNEKTHCIVGLSMTHKLNQYFTPIETVLDLMQGIINQDIEVIKKIIEVTENTDTENYIELIKDDAEVITHIQAKVKYDVDSIEKNISFMQNKLKEVLNKEYIEIVIERYNS